MTNMTMADYSGHFASAPGYCDFARFGPVSLDVARVVGSTMDTLAGGRVDWAALEAGELEARQLAAQLTGRQSADQVVLSSSTSPGLFHLAFSLPGGSASEVLVGPGEFPANIQPWLRAGERQGPTPRVLPSGPVTPEMVADALTPSSVALAVSAVDYRTGYRADLQGLRQVLGDRLLLVDSIQGFGAVDMEWGVADAVVVGGQKWLRSSWGTGFTSLSEAALDRLGAGLTGWWGMQDPMGFSVPALEAQPSPTARRFAMTAPDLVKAAALAAGLRLLRDAGPAAVGRAIAERTDMLVRAVEEAGGSLLQALGPKERSGIVSFSLPGTSPEAVAGALATRGITVSARPGHVRVSAHATTPLPVIEEIASVLAGASS